MTRWFVHFAASDPEEAREAVGMHGGPIILVLHQASDGRGVYGSAEIVPAEVPPCTEPTPA